jgi:hypothetical protein
VHCASTGSCDRSLSTKLARTGEAVAISSVSQWRASPRTKANGRSRTSWAIALPAPYRPGQAGAVRVAGLGSARTGPAALPGQSPSLRPKVMRDDSQCAGGQGQDEKGTPISGGGWQSRCQAGGPTGRGRGRVHQCPDNYRSQIGAGGPAPPVAENGCRRRSRQYEVECDNQQEREKREAVAFVMKPSTRTRTQPGVIGKSRRHAVPIRNARSAWARA